MANSVKEMETVAEKLKIENNTSAETNYILKQDIERLQLEIESLSNLMKEKGMALSSSVEEIQLLNNEVSFTSMAVSLQTNIKLA